VIKRNRFRTGSHRVLVKGILGLIVIMSFGLLSYGQSSRFRPLDFNESVYKIKAKKFVIPSVLVGYGFSQFIVPQVKDLNLKVKSEIAGNISHTFRIDDYSQYVPALSVYALNMIGINGKHNFLDRSIILGTSMAVMGVTVSGIKYLSHLQRPDGTAFNAFPSGHTATAFVCAEFLYQEYKDVSVWYGIAGYTIAAGTGFMRIYNNRHWLTDVVAGAGFGIISTKVGYWVFPKLKKLFFKDIRISVSLMPSFVPQYGLIQ